VRFYLVNLYSFGFVFFDYLNGERPRALNVYSKNSAKSSIINTYEIFKEI
jgi:hypothetical protein